MDREEVLWTVHILELVCQRLTSTLSALETVPYTPRIERLTNQIVDALQISSQILLTTIDNATQGHANSDSGRESQSQ